MDADATEPAHAPGTRRTRARRSTTRLAREARERRLLLAELAELLRTNPFLAVEV